mmetsp:Transcript_25554/g.55861  ORF Transcript_25554/g.55861 Transcript_25554/m.55861 type:complete len:545 (+) Transcript_25554:278-1912(+)
MSSLRRRLGRESDRSAIDGVKQTWEEMYDELVDYHSEHGDCRVNTHDTKLGRWVSTQRARYNQGELASDRVELLEALGFDWVLQERDGPIRDWMGMLKELRQYKERHGDCLVPTLTTKLGRWVTTQRARRDGATGSAAQLTPDQVELLDDLGFVWRLKGDSYSQVSWDDMFQALVEYQQAHGNCRVPNMEPHARLWRWIGTQRQKYKSEQLSSEQIQKMEDLGFVWSVFEKDTRSWDDMHQELQEFHEENGHCRVPKSHDGKLAYWVRRQRILRKRSIPGWRDITPDQIRLLEDLDFVWDAANYDEIWDENFSELEAYAEATGHCRVPRLSGPLGTWVAKQRQCRHQNSGSNRQLTEEQIARLDSIGFVWRADDNIESWEAMYEKLREYKMTNGNCLVPQSQGKLGSWVDIQRRRKDGPVGRQKQLTPERVALLDELNFAWTAEERFSQLWDMMFDELKDYVEEHGHCKVPTQYVGSGKGPAKLGKWVERQRARRKSPEKYTPLTEDQTQRLTEIGFVWAVGKRKQPTSANQLAADKRQRRRRK